MTTETLVEALERGIVRMTYTKLNGEARQATGTRHSSLVQGQVFAAPYALVDYWDLDADAWRSFYMDRVVSWEFVRTAEEELAA